MLDTPFHWIIDSLNIIKCKNDAPLAGGFTGAVVELLGRFLLYPNDTYKGKTRVKNRECFYEFIDKYLKERDLRYSTHKETLWYFLRCEGAHNVLAQNAVIFTGDQREQNKHLGVHDYPFPSGIKMRFLFIYLPDSIDDLKWAIEEFCNNLRQDKNLHKKYRQVMSIITRNGQKHINDNFPV